jgi:hypothetical protein
MMNRLLTFLLTGAVGACISQNLRAGSAPKASGASDLKIDQDAATGSVVVSWNGKGVLKEASSLNGRYKPVRKTKKAGPNTAAYITEPTEDAVVYRVENSNGGIVSGNIVGYVNLALGPGLSLIANPLFYTNNTLAFWLPTAPDGAQVYKLTAGGGFEVSTFDAIERAWTNPDLEVPLGTGFYFNNPSTEIFRQLFVGEVLQGVLINPLPEGISTVGSLVPQSGSINFIHGIPGEPGDEIRIRMNDGQSPTIELSSVFTVISAQESRWEPDLNLGVGQGFWINKQHAQDWVRVFSAFSP